MSTLIRLKQLNIINNCITKSNNEQNDITVRALKHYNKVENDYLLVGDIHSPIGSTMSVLNMTCNSNSIGVL